MTLNGIYTQEKQIPYNLYIPLKLVLAKFSESHIRIFKVQKVEKMKSICVKIDS